MVFEWIFRKRNYPNMRKRFIDNFKEMTGTYPLMFGRNGQMIMWGRSIIYRFAAVSPFGGIYEWFCKLWSFTSYCLFRHFAAIPSESSNLLADECLPWGFMVLWTGNSRIQLSSGSVLDGKLFKLIIAESNPFVGSEMKAFGVTDRKNPVKTHSRTVQRFSSWLFESGISEIRTSTRCRPMRVKIGDIRKL